MKRITPFILIVLALATVLFSLMGDASYGKLTSLRRAVVEQQEENKTLKDKVVDLRSEVGALRDNDRELEKAARNELGLARPNEQIFIFDKKGEK